MKSKVISLLLLAAVSVNLTGCFAGRTSVVASQYASTPYDIYLNGKQVCKMGNDDDCSFQTRGTRAGGMLEAYLNGQRVGSTNIHREITMASILFAPFTYCLSIWLYKAYPDEIEIPIDTYLLRNGGNNEGFDNGGSVWDRPYNLPKKSKKVEAPVEEPTEENAPATVRDGATEDSSDEPAPAQKSVWD